MLMEIYENWIFFKFLNTVLKIVLRDFKIILRWTNIRLTQRPLETGFAVGGVVRRLVKKAFV